MSSASPYCTPVHADEGKPLTDDEAVAADRYARLEYRHLREARQRRRKGGMQMTRRVSMREAGAQFSELVEAILSTREPVVVERDGVPVVVIVTPEQWQALERTYRRAWARIDELRARNAHLDPDGVLADVTAEVEAVRQEMHEERQRTDTRRD